MERKLRKLACSLVITLPKQLCDVYERKNYQKIIFMITLCVTNTE